MPGRTKNQVQFSLKSLLLAMVAIASLMGVSLFFLNKAVSLKPEGAVFRPTSGLPACSLYWFYDEDDKIVSGFAAFGSEHPSILVSHSQGSFRINGDPNPILVPRNGLLHVLAKDGRLVRTNCELRELIPDYKDYETWGVQMKAEIDKHAWNPASE